MPSDFWVWTFAYDVSGLARVDLRYRVDGDGTNSTASDHNETYAGGGEVGAWQTLAMNHRDFPKGNFFGDPSINFSVLPDYIADEYYVQVTGLSEQLIDYYVEAEDSLGHVKRSPIQHVWIGASTGSPSHVIDGSLDTTSTLVASNGSFALYADWDGEYLYLAAEGVGQTSGWDHFILVGEDLSTPVAAPWAKAGTVADRTLFIGNEDSNNWCGWFDDLETVITTDVDCASGSYLEGIVKLETYLSPLPDQVYLAVGGYSSPDGGSLQDQAPAGNGNGSVEAAEYVTFPLTVSGIEPDPLPPGFCGQVKVGYHGSPTQWVRVYYELAEQTRVEAEVFSVTGARIRVLADRVQPAAGHQLDWDLRDRSGRRVSTGIYILRLKTPHGAHCEKIAVVR
jgi:hypothetical protein